VIRDVWLIKNFRIFVFRDTPSYFLWSCCGRSFVDRKVRHRQSRVVYKLPDLRSGTWGKSKPE